MTLLRRLPRPILALLAAFGLIAALQATPALAPADTPLVAQQAQAAEFPMKVCHSTDSVGDAPIFAYNTKTGYGKFLYSSGPEGERCTPYLSSPSYVRVDTLDVDSYKIKGNDGYGPCHDHGITDSNPPDVSLVYYKTYEPRSNCT